MSPVKYQEVNVRLSAATFSRLAQANPFNKHRVADQAIEMIRVALFTIYPPSTPEEWKDRSRFQGMGRHMLLVWYDLVCYLLRKWTSKDADQGRSANHDSQQSTQVTLKIPIALVGWIEKIARSQQSTIPEATIYAIEHGLRDLDSQGDSEQIGKRSREVLRHIFCAIWKH